MSSELSMGEALENSIETKADNAIAAHNLSKVYHLYNAPSDRLKQIMFGRNRKFFDEYTALNEVSFQLPKGEVLGLVGRNGAGKSTLLQLICGTLTPTSGELIIHGRIAALLELGAGFNLEFTGRENIYLSATVMGIEKKEIDEKLEEIIDFSGVRPFIDQPVKTYSSGMYVRLAFSVATSVEPDILVIDEALSVGDGDFARRSFERIMAMRDAGKTILFCSHSLYQVEALCTQAIWLEKGQVRASGKPELIVPEYQSFLDQLENKGSGAAVPASRTQLQEEASVNAENQANARLDLCSEPENTDASSPQSLGLGRGARLIRITASADGVSGNVLQLNSRSSSLCLDVEFQTTLVDETPQVALAIHSAAGQLITSCGSWVDGINPAIDSQGNGRIQVVYEQLPLLKGTYYVGVLLFCERGIFLHDEADPAVTLHVSQPNKERGIVYLPHRWLVQGDTIQDNPPEAAAEVFVHKPRWRSVSADDVSQTSLLALFEQVFGYALDPHIWRWKYRFADTPGSVVLDNDRLVAFSGGIPRVGLVFGQAEKLVQMGDVMVAKDVRGILSKKGPFYLAMKDYLTPRVGPGLPYSLAFGFPNERACKVGVARGLYNIVDKIVELHWTPMSDAADQVCALQLVDITKDSYWCQQVDALWQAMKQDVNDVAIGSRDSQWIKHRYVDKPVSDYLIYFVSGQSVNNLDSSVLGLLVMKRHESQAMELLDMVGPRTSVPALINAARQITATNQTSYLFAWATPSVLEWFTDTAPQVNPTEVVVPGCNINSPEHALRVKDRWWLLGGDSDFR